MGISQMLPTQEGAQAADEQLLYPGDERTLGGYLCCGGDGESPVYGQRWSILLATREPNEFWMLKQEGLPRIAGGGEERLASSPTRGAAPSSLEEILLEQTYFRTRGDRRLAKKRDLYDATWTAAAVSWLAAPPLETADSP